MLMNASDKPAVLRYGPAEYRMVSPGTYVICAVSAAQIPLEDLRYWSAAHQEAYASPELATRRLAAR